MSECMKLKTPPEPHLATDSDVFHVLTFSGGKGSTALLLLAREYGVDCEIVFADTGHEHDLTYEYLDYIEKKLGVRISRVKADFSDRIAKKREFIKKNWHKEIQTTRFGRKKTRRAFTSEEIATALEHVKPTGNPMRDLLAWKGVNPTPMQKFCSMELKQIPVMDQVYQPAMDSGLLPISWQGVRAQESSKRSGLPPVDYVDGVVLYRPILLWTHDDVFRMHKRHGIEPNPLYKKGMARVGCMPCICSSKRELREVARRLPAVVEKVTELEKLIAMATRHPEYRERGIGSFLAGTGVGNDGMGVPYAEWVKTMEDDRDGQTNWVSVFETDELDLDQCSAVYPIVCE